MSMTPAPYATGAASAAATGAMNRIDDPFDDSYDWVGYESAPPQACALLQAATGADAADAGPSAWAVSV